MTAVAEILAFLALALFPQAATPERCYFAERPDNDRVEISCYRVTVPE